MTGGRVDYDILFCRGVMAYEVILPWRDALTYKCEGILSAYRLFIDADCEVAHLSCRIRKRFVLTELIRYSADGYAEQRGSCRYGLRHNYCTPLVAYACRHC